MTQRESFEQRFRSVGRDRLAAIRAIIATGPIEGARAEEIRREVHSLKGEARVVGFEPIAQLAHALEEKLRGEVGDIEVDLAQIEDGIADPRVIDPIDPSLRVDVAAIAELGRAISELRVGETELARWVSEIVAMAGELSMAVRDGDRQYAELASRLRRAASGGKQLIFDQHARVDRLDDRLRVVRMVPVATLLGSFGRVVRRLAAELHKEVELVVEDGGVEIDREVLDAIGEPLMHLVHNSIDHGLERADARITAGKPPHGTLRLRAHTSGSMVAIEVEDDGRGIDLDALQSTLRLRGSDVDPRALDGDRLLEILCSHGLSTRRDVSHVSGRGVGLDVVKRRVEAIGGRLRLASTATGATFSMHVPISAVLATMLCAINDGVRYAFAPHEVELLVEAGAARVEGAGEGLVIRLEDGAIPFFDLAALFGVAGHDPRKRGAILVLVHGAHRIAIALDRVIGAMPVLQQRLDPLLERATAVRSVALFSSGDLAVIVDVAELFRRSLHHVERPPVAPNRIERSARVLIVDDSELTRDVVVSLVRDLGMVPAEAINGERALEMVSSDPPDLVITDLDMPVLDGFELVRRIRASARHGSLPIVVLSTRGAPDDIQRASELGADAYLVKSRLELDDLRRVIGAQLEHAR